VSVGDENFVALQRKGVLQAFNEHPLFGIGWGGFWESRYSPTGHEVHSTPLRFLAELGLVGVALYGTFVILLLTTTARLSALMRRSPYGASYLALAVALWSLCVSYTYNRHLTERTFWLLLAVLFTLEAFARRWQAAQRRAAAGPPSPGGPPALAAPKR
jgi:O-antigen ligase